MESSVWLFVTQVSLIGLTLYKRWSIASMDPPQNSPTVDLVLRQGMYLCSLILGEWLLVENDVTHTRTKGIGSVSRCDSGVWVAHRDSRSHPFRDVSLGIYYCTRAGRTYSSSWPSVLTSSALCRVILELRRSALQPHDVNVEERSKLDIQFTSWISSPDEEEENQISRLGSSRSGLRRRACASAPFSE